MPTTIAGDALQSALEAAIALAKERKYAQPTMDATTALESDDYRVAGAAAVDFQEAAERLSGLVQQDARFPGGNVLFVRELSGLSGFYPNFVGAPLLKRAIKSGDPNQAIAWLQKVLGASHATGHSVATLWGVTVAERAYLTSDVEIVPIDKLPDSPQKRWLNPQPMNRMGALPVSSMQLGSPQSAIVMRHRIEPVIVPSDSKSESDPAFNEQYKQSHDIIAEIALALTAVGPRLSLLGSQWFSYDDPDFADALMGFGRSMSMAEILPRTLPKVPHLNVREAQVFVQSYLTLNAGTRALVRVALQRLNFALRRHGPGDQAVELCTALESLMGDGATTEMSHKVKVRATRLIGGDSKARRRNAAIIKRVYGMRSKLVHTGQVSEDAEVTVEGERLAASGLIAEAEVLCARLIQAITAAGTIPNWAEFDIN